MTDEKFHAGSCSRPPSRASPPCRPRACLVSPADAETLSESDATAKSLGYVADAKKVDPKANPNYKPGQHCANCMQYTGKAGSAAGPCNIFPGKDVAAAGWCKVWVLKPGAKAG